MTKRPFPLPRWLKPAAGVAAVVVVAVLLVPGLSAGGSGPAVESPLKTAEKGPCLLPAPDMRRQHQALLFEEQEMAVRHGLRNPQNSLNRCVTCHAVSDDDGQPIPYQDERHFCRACHRQVAVSLDCFNCHRSTPLTPPESAEKP